MMTGTFRTRSMAALTAVMVCLPAHVLAVSPDDPEGIVAAFVDWAAQNVEPVAMPACGVPEFVDDEGITACYGTARGGVVTAFLTFDGDELVSIAGHAVAAGSPTMEPTGTPPDGFPPSFPDGTWYVNEDIAPGTYQTTTALPPCDWEQSSSSGATVNGRATPDGQWVVTILPSDEMFWSEDCVEWVWLGSD